MRERPQRERSSGFWSMLRRHGYMIPLVLIILAVAAGGAYATMPQAGTAITNQAFATYDEQSRTGLTAQSLTVSTTVNAVYAFTYGSAITQPVAKGTQYNFPLTITNSGNINDTYNIALTAGFDATAFQTIVFYGKTGGGQPDIGAGPISSLSVPLGTSKDFFAVVTIKGTAATGSYPFTVPVTNHAGAGTTSNVTDTVTVTDNAVIAVSKSVSPGTAGVPGGATVYTYTLQYNNTTPTAAGTALHIIDTISAGLTLDTASVKWNSTSLPLATNSVALAGAGITTYTVSGSLVDVTIANIAGGASGTITFNATISLTAAAGVISNTAKWDYNNGVVAVAQATSNSVDITVAPAGWAFLSDADVAGGNKVDATADDIVLNAPLSQGLQTVTFKNILVNRGDATDQFVISVQSNGFTGSSYKIRNLSGSLQATGGPLTITPGVPAGGLYEVYVDVTIPASFTSVGAVDLVLKATSQYATVMTGGVLSDTVTDRVPSIAASTVDLTAKLSASDVACTDKASCGRAGYVAGDPAVETTPANPVTTAVFKLYINNTGPVSDTYTMSAGTSNLMAAFPAGWTVAFFADGGGSCSTLGVPLGPVTVASLGNSLVCAQVQVTNGIAPIPAQDIFFKTTSTLGASDIVRDAVNVTPYRKLVFGADPNTNAAPGTLVAGGNINYNFTITNQGNVPEGDAATGADTFVLADSFTPAVYSTQALYDLKALNTNAALAVNGTLSIPFTVFANVAANSAPYLNNNDITAITITSTTGTNSAVLSAITPLHAYSKIVAPGGLQVVKTQCVAGCTSATCTYGAGDTTADPGACIFYKVTVTNQNTWDVTNVQVTDSTPPFTIYNTGADCYVGNVLTPANGAQIAAVTGGGNTITTVPAANAYCMSTGFTFGLGTLTPTSSKDITFKVQVVK